MVGVRKNQAANHRQASMSDFLAEFFAATQHDIELRTVPMVSRCFSRDTEVIDSFIKRNVQTNLFFGCCTRSGMEGKKPNCRELVAFWVDIDYKEVPEEEAKAELYKFPLQPSIIIASGGGLHVYWLLKEPHDAQDIRCEAIMRGLATALHGDHQATDVSRILRIPGTLNHKYKPPRPVTVLHCNWEQRHNIGDFDLYQEVQAPEEPKETRTGKVGQGGRTKALISLAGFMNRKGNTLEEIEAALLGLNSRFEKPFTEREVKRKAKSIFEGYAKQHGNGAAPEVELSIEHITADEIVPEPLAWLWENRIPLGKLTVFVGVPDTGKSTVAIDIASRCTTGAPWPDAVPRRTPCDVLMLISEDDLKDTVVPRLIASGANLQQIHFAVQTIVQHKEKRLERRIALDTDLKALESMLVQNPEIKLVIADPLGSYLGKLKKNTEEDIRWVLTEMKELAERANVAIISIDHFNKNTGQSAIHRLSGAGALAAVPRAVWAFVKDADDPEKITRLMLNAKLNVVAEAKKQGMKYYSVGMEISIKGIQSSLPVINWCGASTGDLEEILQRQSDPEKTRSGKCGKWLTEKLGGVGMMSREVYAAAEEAGFSGRTVKRAMREIEVVAVKTKSGWKMELPNKERGDNE